MLAFAASGFLARGKKSCKKKSLFPSYNFALHNEKPQFILTFFPGPSFFRFSRSKDGVIRFLYVDLARAKSEALDNIYSLFKQNIKSCNAKRRRHATTANGEKQL